MLVIGKFLEWLLEQRSSVAIGLSVTLFAITLIMRYGFDLWWPWGIAVATILAIIGMVGVGD